MTGLSRQRFERFSHNRIYEGYTNYVNIINNQ